MFLQVVRTCLGGEVVQIQKGKGSDVVGDKAKGGECQKHNKRCYLRVRVSAIKNIGCQRKDRHKWFVGKFHK